MQANITDLDFQVNDLADEPLLVAVHGAYILIAVDRETTLGRGGRRGWGGRLFREGCFLKGRFLKSGGSLEEERKGWATRRGVRVSHPIRQARQTNDFTTNLRLIDWDKDLTL